MGGAYGMHGGEKVGIQKLCWWRNMSERGRLLNLRLCRRKTLKRMIKK